MSYSGPDGEIPEIIRSQKLGESRRVANLQLNTAFWAFWSLLAKYGEVIRSHNL